MARGPPPSPSPAAVYAGAAARFHVSRKITKPARNSFQHGGRCRGFPRRRGCSCCCGSGSGAPPKPGSDRGSKPSASSAVGIAPVVRPRNGAVA
eukprot:351996-Chlamydomonas_euryale.AAC.2